MSWVFLAGDRVYKLKKAVRYPYLDFSTLSAREFYCREELRLNGRLASGIYLGVVPLVQGKTGKLSFAGEGSIVDWVIEMRRLPADRMLDVMLKSKLIGQDDVARLAHVLADFYRKSQRPAAPPDMSFHRSVGEMMDNRNALTCTKHLLDQSKITTLLDRVDAELLKARGMLEERSRSGHIVDGHGDLRPEHICMTEPIVIFDCLEFNPRLRLVDPFDELVFLGLECARLEAPWFGPALIEKVAHALSEEVPHDLIPLYTALHAVLRARLSLAHLLDPTPRDPAKWTPLAQQYLDLAEHALK
ncbi:hypothetical protein [Microvirga alba]|uniref:Aminoglycoside phosphotransferase domain-containing protein n=1 Tax=Microvirga alba TaxID=2791025 RepID=A0A931BMJ6_9HYPH|nr:hypothetical protein [Microvirga alba]MBF9232648.1 hypothetical protein [Microvirga alba]